MTTATPEKTRTATAYLIFELDDTEPDDVRVWREIGVQHAHSTDGALRTFLGDDGARVGTTYAAVARSSFQPKTAKEREVKTRVVFG